MIELKEGEFLNELPRFKHLKDFLQPFLATDSYSFGITPKGKLISGEYCHTGCHSFVKSRLYGENHNLVVILPEINGKFNCFYEESDIETYINLLKEIGFQIEFKGIQTDFEIYNIYGASNNYLKDRKNYVFILGENYKFNKAAIRYIALCLLRNLWNVSQFWFPYRFIEFYKYFKKRKIKPSLSKILIFANLCPYNLLSDKYISKRFIQKSGDSWINIKDNINKESGLLYGYYSLIGNCKFDRITLSEENKVVYKGFYLSLLLTAENNFNLIDFLENYDTLSKKEKIQFNNFNQEYGKTRIIFDEENLLNNKLRDLIISKEYYKAYLFLKEIAIFYKQYPDLHFTNVDVNKIEYSVITTYFYLRKDESKIFIQQIIDNLSKEKKTNGKKTKK